MTTIPDFTFSQQVIHTAGANLQSWAERRAARRAKHRAVQLERSIRRAEKQERLREVQSRREETVNQLHLGPRPF